IAVWVGEGLKPPTSGIVIVMSDGRGPGDLRHSLLAHAVERIVLVEGDLLAVRACNGSFSTVVVIHATRSMLGHIFDLIGTIALVIGNIRALAGTVAVRIGIPVDISIIVIMIMRVRRVARPKANRNVHRALVVIVNGLSDLAIWEAEIWEFDKS